MCIRSPGGGATAVGLADHFFVLGTVLPTVYQIAGDGRFRRGKKGSQLLRFVQR